MEEIIKYVMDHFNINRYDAIDLIEFTKFRIIFNIKNKTNTDPEDILLEELELDESYIKYFM